MAEMTNADLFQREFGIYATELWAMQEDNFLEWLNAQCDRPKNLPSAQPEIVRCKECQYYLYDKIFRQDWCSHANGMSKTRPNDFCSKGVRRADAER